MLYLFADLFSIAAESSLMSVSLTDKEKQLCDLLRNVISTKTPNTTLRIAGGWVRDKLMGKSSNDIDIAVDNMTGEAFATLVNDYLKEHGSKSQTVSVIQANPDQSKHLATATIRLFGLPIDFVNLRTETYANSRIPTIEIGSPEEDAQRRDLTINSLFYNINTESIEDYVGGINDLRSGIARTPLDPVQTFLDDPLRILRTVRFAAKYNLTLDPSLISAANNPAVKQAFKDKISKERIWTELAGKKENEKYKPGALIGPNPTRAIELLKELGLLEAIFDPSEDEIKQLKPISKDKEKILVPWNTPQNNTHHAFDIWGHTLSVVKNLVNNTHKNLTEDQETYLVRNIAALLHDIGKRYTGIQGVTKDGIHTSYHGHEETSAKIAEMVLTKLHAPQNIIKRVVDLINVHLQPHTLLDNGSSKSYRRFVRDNPDWTHSIDLAIADNLGKQEFTPDQITEETAKYENLRNKIQEAMQWEGKPTNANSITRPITGKDLLDLGLKPGPVIGTILKELDEALLDNPGMSKEQALEIAKKYI